MPKLNFWQWVSQEWVTNVWEKPFDLSNLWVIPKKQEEETLDVSSPISWPWATIPSQEDIWLWINDIDTDLQNQLTDLESWVVSWEESPVFNIETEEPDVFERLANTLIPTAQAKEFDEEKIKRFIEHWKSAGKSREEIRTAYDKWLATWSFDLVWEDIEEPKEEWFLESIKYIPFEPEEVTAYDPNKTETENLLEWQKKYWSNVAWWFYNIIPAIAQLWVWAAKWVTTDVWQRLGNFFWIVSDEDLIEYTEGKNKATWDLLGWLADHYKTTYWSIDWFNDALLKDPTAIVSDILTVAWVWLAWKAKLTDSSIKALNAEKANIITKVKGTKTLEAKSVLIKEWIETSKKIASKSKQLELLKEWTEAAFKYDPYVAIPKGIIKAPGLVSEKISKLFPEASLDELILKVSQWKAKDVKDVKKALWQIDTTEAATYNDLNKSFDGKISELAKKQDELLPTEAVHKVEDLTTTVWKRKTNFIEESLNDLEKVGKAENDLELLAKVDSLRDKTLVSTKDINDLARFYWSKFKSKAFDKMGNQKSSLTASRFENNRSWLKNISRELLPDDTVKALDSELSSLFTAKELTGKMADKVNDLLKKIEDRWLIENIARGIWKWIDIATFGWPRAFLSSFLPSNVWNKILNSLDIQKNLSKHLKTIEKLTKKWAKISDDVLIKETQKILSPEKPKPIIPTLKSTDIDSKVMYHWWPKKIEWTPKPSADWLTWEWFYITPEKAVAEWYWGLKGWKTILSEFDAANLNFKEFKTKWEYYNFLDSIDIDTGKAIDIYNKQLLKEWFDWIWITDDVWVYMVFPEKIKNIKALNKTWVIKSTDIDIKNTKQVDNLYESYKTSNTDNWLVIDSDDIKKMFSDFDSKKPELVHKQSSELSQKFYEKTLAENPSKKVVLTAWGGWSWKSEILIKNIKAWEEAIVFDWTGKSYDKMIKNYELAKTAWKNPQIDAIFINYNVAKKFNQMRSRTVPEKLLQGTHSWYRSTLLRILKERPDIKVNLTENMWYKNANWKVVGRKIPQNNLIDFLEVRQKLEK